MRREAQPQTSDATKSLPLWYWLLNFLSPNAVQLDQQPHSCLASETNPPQLFRVEILDHSSTLLQTVLCGGAPRGCTASHSSYSEVARSPQSLVKLIIRARIARFLPVTMSYPLFHAWISCWWSSFPLPLSTWQGFEAVLIDKARRKRLCLCHCHQHVHFVTNFLNTEQTLEARQPNQQPTFPRHRHSCSSA